MARSDLRFTFGIIALVAFMAAAILLTTTFLAGQELSDMNVVGEAFYTSYPTLASKVYVSLSTCSDTDGSNKKTKGTTTLGSQSSIDICRSSSTVREFFCTTENSVGYHDYSCDSGEICHDGACKWGCYDSDAGVNIHHSGWVHARTVASDGSLQESMYYDRCTGPGDLIDYVCTSTARADHHFAFCSSSELCYGGACVPKCWDNDFRDDVLIKGRVEAYEQLKDGSVRSTTLYDSCGSTSFVNQISCRSDGGYISTGTVCPAGTTCVDGRCA